MNEELNVNATDVVEEAVENCETVAKIGSRNFLKLGVVLGTVVAVGGVIAIVVHKNKSKINEWRAEKLRKKGYIVFERTDSEQEDVEEDEVVESTEE